MLREIGGRPIGRSHPVFVIAEIGLNHGGRLEAALALVDAAADAGASAVKLQTLYADSLVAPDCPAPAHVSASSLREFFRTFELDARDHRAVVDRARQHGLAVMSTPFSEDAVPMLETLDLDAYKIASGDLTHDGLIAAAARTGRPLVISTGMSDLDEILRAVQVARTNGATDLALLHCVSAYPTPSDSQNLEAIRTLADATGLPVGLSDHGPGLLSAVIAATLGATLYERHLVASDEDDAIDRAVSSTPAELAAIIDALAQTRLALGDGIKRCLAAEAPNRIPSRRGLYAAVPLRAGDTVKPDDIAVLRPANELTPKLRELLIGTTLTRDVPAGAPFLAADLAVVERA
ncbi:MAG TPA: N-acetylneuraminate synthase family protein [Vicinamibacterales bacterium]